MSQKQSQLESVGDYIKRIKLIDAESNLQEETYMTVFIRGLREQIRYAVENYNPKTSDEARYLRNSSLVRNQPTH